VRHGSNADRRIDKKRFYSVDVIPSTTVWTSLLLDMIVLQRYYRIVIQRQYQPLVDRPFRKNLGTAIPMRGPDQARFDPASNRGR
jgi:hypothetical protein